jgi:hypothetical protein
MKTNLSTLWVFVMFNYLYCDILGLMDPGLLSQFMAGSVGGMQINQGFLLQAAILMEIPTAMVLLSRVFPYGANRWTNIIAGAIMTVVQLASLFMGSSPSAYYIFFSVIEIACTLFILVSAWRWRNAED